MKKNNKIIALLLITMCLFAISSTTLAFAESGEKTYYVCFSNQNYSIRNANKLIAVEDDEYILENITLNGTVGFYVTDNAGIKYFAKDGEDMTVNENGNYKYTIKFSPSKTYLEDDGKWQATDSHITYSFYIPDNYEIDIDGDARLLNYNSYFTAYDLYYISSVYLNDGATVSYETEIHTIAADGYYRILFTPGKINGGNTYMFNEKGQYGSGDDFKYRLYIEDSHRYYMTVKGGLSKTAPNHEIEINGESAYLMTRYEQNTLTAEYRTEPFFIDKRDYSLKYYIYEEQANGSYRLIDDDNNEDTAMSKKEITDAGWHQLSMTDSGNSYMTTTVAKTFDFDGYYLVGEFNGYGYTEIGELDLNVNYRFVEIMESEEDYNEDYEQFRLDFTVTQKDLYSGDVEFYITDGKTKYKNADAYIKLSEVGTYKILFSSEHIYGRGRNYRYTLISENAQKTELVIGTTAEFLSFAISCNESADYSINKIVYLSNDLDFSNEEFITVKTFSGIFYGGYRTMKNITVSGNGNELGVFGTVTKTGKIERLNIENLIIDSKNSDYLGFVCKNYGTLNGITVSGRIYGNNYVGGVVGYNGRLIIGDNSTTDSNKIYQKGLIINCTNNGIISGEINIGGIAGFNIGEIRAAKNYGNIDGKVSTTNGTAFNLGGISGYSVGKISDCQNYGNVIGGSSSLYVGGVAGLCTGEMYFLVNHGQISGNSYAGGIIGYYGLVAENQSDLSNYFGGIDYQAFLEEYFSDDGENFEEAEGNIQILTYLINYGNVNAKSYAGGVLGCTQTVGLPIKNSVSTGNIVATAGNYAGGIAAYANGAEIIGCMSAGRIEAKGMNGSKYVGGIVGYGSIVRYSMSSAELIGSDYIGGISGYIINELTSCYTNVLIIADKDATYFGGIAGYAESYDESQNNFSGLLSYNYYIGEIGGINGKSFNNEYDDAAAKISSDKLSSADNLSPYLGNGFSNDYWLGGNGVKSYPMPYYFEFLEETNEYDDELMFANIFDKYSSELNLIAENYTRITYTIVFMEWNEDNGKLYDEDELLCENFQPIHSVRLFEGENLEVLPDFIYAMLLNGKWIYEGKDAHYFVSFPPISGDIRDNIIIYADYREIATSLTDESGKVIVEGLFDSEVKVEIVEIGANYGLRFTLNGEIVEVGKINVKFFVGENSRDYELFYVNGTNLINAQAKIYGEYLCFDYEDGYFITQIKEPNTLPSWAWALIGGGIIVCIGMIAFGINALVKNKSKMNIIR